jgi:hypothetical protein
LFAEATKFDVQLYEIRDMVAYKDGLADTAGAYPTFLTLKPCTQLDAKTS